MYAATDTADASGRKRGVMDKILDVLIIVLSWLLP
jgi:hypothetical protein